MASSSAYATRLARLSKRVESDLAALPDRDPSPPLEPTVDDDTSGGISLVDPQDKQQDPIPAPASAIAPPSPPLDALKKVTLDPPFAKDPSPIPASDENERRFIWKQDATSSYNLGTMSKLPALTTASLPPNDLKKGQLATEKSFAPLLAVSRFPYKFCDFKHKQDIASAFFDEGKFWDREWDLYYVWGIEEAKVLILISESQFQELVTEINIGLQLSLRITDQQREEGLVGRFPDHPRCQPRYLGRSRSKDEYNSLVDNVPSELFRLTGEPEMTALEGNTLADFKKAWEDMLDATKAKSKATKEKRKVDRLMKQKVFADQFKRAQRYLGLRPTAHGKTAPPLEAIDSSLPAPFQFDQSVVFVCVDVEAYERAHDIITEIGISTLDTRDLNGVAPGEDGASWRSKIHARHFRIQEYHHLVNSKYVSGCPERFDFGKSEFVRKNDAADMVAKCFEAPFCGPGPRTDASRAEKRNLIFLGHDTLGDVKYLQQVGFDALKLPNLLESQDTAVLYRVWRRELQSTKLGNILYDFDIPGFNLHNAGNDAMLTLQALLGILVREASTRGTTELQTARAEEVKAMVSAATEEAEEKTLDEFNGWDQHENDGDGGAPVPIVIKETPHLAISKRPASPVNSEGRGRGRGGFVGVGGRGGNISNGYVPTYTNDSNAYNTGGYRGNRGSQTNSRGDGRGGGHGRGRGRGSHNYNNSSGSNGGASGQQRTFEW